MKIRRYLAKNTQEAMLKVKLDLGSDAVILSTRKVRKKGIKNIFSKPMFEVTAAIDDFITKKTSETNTKTAEKDTVSDMHKEDSETIRINNLEKKVSGMEQLLQKIYEQLSGSKKTQSVPGEKDSNSKVLQLIYDNLVKNEVEPEYAAKIIEILKTRIGPNSNVNETAEVLHNIISGMLGKPETIKLREDNKPTVVVFFGPTGVGKTTTIAKVAANYLLNKKKSIGMITADTYRIAAVEQLRTYADILGIPVNVIYSPAEMKEAVNKLSDKDLILIDTAGRNHRNKSQFEELRALSEAIDFDEVFLLLSVTTNLKICKELFDAYKFLKDYKVIFTKVDEVLTYGMILNTRLLTQKCISYITTGQSVPDDIEVANVEKIVKNLLGSMT